MQGLIDADILVFRAGFAAEKNMWFLRCKFPATEYKAADWWSVPEQYQYKRDALERLDELLPGKYSREEGTDYQLWSERQIEPVENALYLVKKQIEKIMEECALSEFDITCYLSGGKNFRYAVAKTRPYKGNRDAAHRPTHEDAIRQYIRGKYNTIVTDGIEADDALGLDQTEDTIIISIDKDLDMIPGMHYNFVNEIHYTITPEQGWRSFCQQLLTGDTTDNIPGLPKIGAVKAAKILDGIENDDLLQAVVTEYASRSGKRDWFAYLEEQAQLLWIHQPGAGILEMLEPYSEGGFDDGTDTPCELY